MDDVLVHGMNQNLHDTRLEAILHEACQKLEFKSILLKILDPVNCSSV
jgi:hypothetical protein